MRDPLPWMEDIGTDIMDRVLAARGAYDPSSYTESDVRRAIYAEPSVEGFAALLSPAAEPLLEEIAARAREVTRAHFGNSVCMFTPLYVSNYCINGCVYCGFHKGNRIERLKLGLNDVARELDAIADVLKRTGAGSILRATSPEDVEAIWQLRREFSYSLKATGLTKLNEDIVIPRSRLVDLVTFCESMQRETGINVACFGHAPTQ